jgi:hypothetical protein
LLQARLSAAGQCIDYSFRSPGMLMLDNLYQQGLSSDVVSAAVERIAAAASNLA